MMEAQQTPAGIPAAWEGKPLRHSWTYHDSAGAVIGHVARFDDADGKSIIPFFTPNGAGFKAGAGPDPRPLFGLESLNGTAPVFVTEGEKCTSALHSLGLAAVTSPGGAQCAHKADWQALQATRRVVLLPDNDVPGEAYTANVARILAGFPGAREVQVCRLPDLPEGGDIVDFLQARVLEWDGFGPVPRTAGDDLAAEVLDAIKEHSEPVPVEWLPQTADGAPEPWEPPVPLDAAVVPAWPGNVFPEPVQAFVDALSASTETPVELAAMMTLAVLAAVAQRRYHVQVRPDYAEPLCLWTLCALPSGSRKSTILRPVTRPLVGWESNERTRLEPVIRRIVSERKTMEYRLDALRRKVANPKTKEADLPAVLCELEEVEANLPDVPTLPQLWAGDVTPESVPVLLANNGECLALLSDEGGLFETLAGRYSRGVPNLDVFLQGHAASPVRVNRTGRPPISLNAPRLSLGLCPQPDVLHSLSAKPGFRGRGLLARFLFAVPEDTLGRRTWDAAPMSESVQAAYDGTVRAMLNHEAGEGLHALRVAPDAYAVWHTFALHIVERAMDSGGIFDHLTDWAGKLPGAVVRMAAVLHVTRHAHGEPWTEPIGVDDMRAALALGDVLSKHALIAFEAMGADAALDGARTILRWIQREGQGEFSRRDVHHDLQFRFRRAGDLDAPLDILCERGYIRQRPRPTRPGRPSVVYEVNPSVQA